MWSNAKKEKQDYLLKLSSKFRNYLYSDRSITLNQIKKHFKLQSKIEQFPEVFFDPQQRYLYYYTDIISTTQINKLMEYFIRKKKINFTKDDTKYHIKLNEIDLDKLRSECIKNQYREIEKYSIKLNFLLNNINSEIFEDYTEMTINYFIRLYSNKIEQYMELHPFFFMNVAEQKWYYS
jgi:hypothetical protein